MMKTIKYFFEAILIYFFFILSKIIGLNLSRKIFSNLFLIFGPIFKSKEIINVIQSKFELKKLIVRSSAISEDGFDSSNAGAYVQHDLRVRGSLSNDGGALVVGGDVNFDSNTLWVSFGLRTDLFNWYFDF